jgi:hypothetical protein
MEEQLMFAQTHPVSLPIPGRLEGATTSPTLRRLHEAVEGAMQRLRATPVHGRMTSGAIDVPGYSELLAGLWTAYSGIEQRLIAFAPTPVLAALPQPRSSLLLEDLATLRLPGVLRSVMKSTAHPPAIHTAAAAIGAVYAVEFIDREAAAMLTALHGNTTLSTACAFLSWCAAQHEHRWFVAQRIAGEAMAAEMPGIVDGAKAAFDALIARIAPAVRATRALGTSREESLEAMAA